MENLITLPFFASQLMYYLRLIVYVNKGTEDDILLEHCIETHNKVVGLIDDNSETTDNHMCKYMKRFNLVLKISANNEPLDLNDAENQANIMERFAHHSIDSDDLAAMIEYVSQHSISPLRGIPLKFILHECKYQVLAWQYTRLLFYISQCIILQDILCPVKKEEETETKSETTVRESDPRFVELMERNLDKIEEILSSLGKLEKQLKIHKVLEEDEFLSGQLNDVKSPHDASEAGLKLKELMREKGIEPNESSVKFIDAIAGRMEGITRKKGNMGQKILRMALGVADDMKDQIESDPQALSDSVVPIVGIFEDFMKDPEKSKNIPNKFKDLFGVVQEKLKNPSGNEEKDLSSILNACNGTGFESELGNLRNMDLSKMMNQGNLSEIFSKVGVKPNPPRTKQSSRKSRNQRKVSRRNVS